MSYAPISFTVSLPYGNAALAKQLHRLLASKGYRYEVDRYPSLWEFRHPQGSERLPPLDEFRSLVRDARTLTAVAELHRAVARLEHAILRLRDASHMVSELPKILGEIAQLRELAGDTLEQWESPGLPGSHGVPWQGGVHINPDFRAGSSGEL